MKHEKFQDKVVGISSMVMVLVIMMIFRRCGNITPFKVCI